MSSQLTTLPATPENLAYTRLVEYTIATCASPDTRRMYRVQLYKFFAGGYPLTREGVALHIQAQRDAGRSSSTLISAVAAIRKLVEEARIRGLITAELAEQIRSVGAGKHYKTRMGTWLTIDQVRQLGALPDRASYWGKRDACMLALMVGCGLRRSEMCALKWDRYQSRDGRMCLVDIVGKGGRRRTLPVPLWAQPDVDAWYHTSRSPSVTKEQGEHLRPTQRDYVLGGMTPDSLHAAIGGYGERLGVAIAPHDLRRTLAQMLRKAGAPLEQIQDTLGHSSINTTMTYLGSKLELAPGLAAVDTLDLERREVITDNIFTVLERERVAIEDYQQGKGAKGAKGAAEMTQTAKIRMSEDGTITMVEDADGFHAPTQDEMDTLPVGDDLTNEEIDGLDS